MKDNIFKFPGIDERLWNRIEESTRSIFAKRGYGRADVADRAINKLKEIFPLLQGQEMTVTLPAGLSPEEIGKEVVKQISACYSEMVTRLAAEVVKQEIDICRLEKGR